MVGISGSDNNITTPTPPVSPAPQSPQTPKPILAPQVPIADSSVNTPEDLDALWTRWKCSVCNYTYEGRNTLKKCPRCGNEDPDKFIDAD